MPLSVGDKLGPYEILAPIGAGGMGEVYRAKDTKLDREVAIKVLPSALAQDPERLARFEREAKVLASLNHPNIAQIYGIEESDAGRALVMELVPGETLQGPLPPETARNYARQVAEALETAHEKGIIHRDLKPANIMITPAGVVKVLDFGLAAVSQPSARSGNLANSPTLTMGMTNAGMIMGTAAYMAPEQAAGQAVDKRADIWSFGVVLYEMLAGTRLFSGDSVAHVLADVLRAAIDFDRLPAATPGAIRDLVKRCLDRDAKTRLRDIGEARILLGGPIKEPPPLTPVQPPSAPRHKSWLPWSIAGILLLGLLPAYIFHFRESPSERTPVRFQIPPPEKASFEPANLDFSPDGRKLAFTATGTDGRTLLWVRSLDSLDPQPLPGTDGATSVFWSPDSRFLGFASQGKLRKIDVSGGPAQALCDLPNGILGGGSWGTRGTIIFGGGSTVFSVPQGGGEATALTTLGPQERVHVRPHFLPDGKHFLFYVGDAGIYLGTLGSKEKKRLAAATAEAYYAPPVAGSENGHLLFLRRPR